MLILSTKVYKPHAFGLFNVEWMRPCRLVHYFSHPNKANDEAYDSEGVESALT